MGPSEIASTGHSGRQVPQATHESVITYAIVGKIKLSKFVLLFYNANLVIISFPANSFGLIFA